MSKKTVSSWGWSHSTKCQYAHVIGRTALADLHLSCVLRAFCQ